MKNVPRDIVFCALVPWGRMPYWRWRSLFRAVTRRGHRVLWVDHFSSWGRREMLAYLRANPRQLRGRLSDEDQGIRLLSSPLRIPRREGLLADAATAGAVRAVQRAIRLTGFEAPLLWTSAPSAEALIGRVGESAVLYDCPDDLRSLGADETMLAREARLEAKADLVLTCMPSVQALKLQGSRRVACVPNGVDAMHFGSVTGRGPVPSRLAGLSRPIVGYSGVLYDRIDWDLVEFICNQRQTWSVVFMGLVQQAPPPRLRALKNLHIFGEVAFEDLPAYYGGIDVCWVPHKVNTLTARQSSLKMLEYLASGRPVVTTDIPVPGDMQSFVHVGRSPLEILQALELAISQDSEGERRARYDVAALHSWDTSYGQIEDVLSQVWV